MEVCDALRSIANLGLTVICVIHQPRFEIFTSFHDCLLLGKGGKVTYLGPTDEALDYFTTCGFPCPAQTNPPDHFMDVISSDGPKLFALWERKRVRGTGAHEEKENESETYTASLETINRAPSSFWTMFPLFYSRSNLQQSRAKTMVVLDNVLVFVAGVFLGLVYFDDPWYVSPLPIEEIEAAGCNPTIASQAQTCFLASQDQILSRGSMSCIAMGLTAVASSIRVFGNERIVYLREASSL